MVNKRGLLISLIGLTLVCGLILYISSSSVMDKLNTIMGWEEDSMEPINTGLHQNTGEDEKVWEQNENQNSDMSQGNQTTVKPEETSESLPDKKHVIVIDAGHQKKGNSELEPIGPNAKEKKKKVSSGTQGRYTGVPEYQVNLEVALQLKKELENRSYSVIMIRETNEVNLSNKERAEIANAAKADAFLRIHCNGSENKKVNGILTICQTKKNPYCGKQYEKSRLLADSLLGSMVETTNAKSKGVTETDTMSGINWASVPVTIIEMGYMTNQEEDEKLVTKEYQTLIVQGMVEGLERYFESLE